MKPAPCHRLLHSCLLAALLLAASPPARAASLCPSTLRAEPLPPLSGPVADAIVLQGRQAEATGNERFVFRGDVRLRQQQQLLRAEQARYLRDQGLLQAEGQVHYQRPGVVIEGDRIRLTLEDEQAQVWQARYYLPEQGGRGRAAALQLSPTRARLQHATYTTCAGERPAWRIEAGEIRLDQARNEGVARHLSLRLGEVPVFYLPYISFPLQGRKSGWLAPQLAYSGSRGMELGLPYYLNLAPQRDLTLTPRHLQRRGLQMGAEFRYLARASEGSARLQYLARDRQLQRQRSLYAWRQQGRLGTARYGLRLNRVSDRDYFRDLGNNLADTSQSQLESRFELTQTWRGWRLGLLAQDYQSLDNNNARPYRLLPRLALGREIRHGRWRYRLDGQYSRFYRGANDQAQRLLLQPAARYELRRPWGHLIPALRLRHSRYRLAQGPRSDRAVDNAVFSLDGGLALQRRGHGQDALLEPRLFYTYSPYRSQNDLPVLDTAPLDINHGQLFRDFRYNGGDRVGDQNRLTLGLGGGLIRHADGRQWLRLDLAEAYYFSDQRIALPGQTRRRAGDRLFSARLRAQHGQHWRSEAELFQQWGQKRPDKLAFRVNYVRDDRLLELGYRYRRALLQQVGAAGYLKLAGPWRLAARWWYSLRNRATPDAMLGLSYGSCCWRVQLLARHYIRDASGQSDRAISLRVELTGLGGGQSSGRLAQDILGFRNEG